jgi:hypothetical protein
MPDWIGWVLWLCALGGLAVFVLGGIAARTEVMSDEWLRALDRSRDL